MFSVQFGRNLLHTHTCSLCGVLYNPFYFMLYCLFVSIGVQQFDLTWCSDSNVQWRWTLRAREYNCLDNVLSCSAKSYRVFRVSCSNLLREMWLYSALNHPVIWLSYLWTSRLDKTYCMWTQTFVPY